MNPVHLTGYSIEAPAFISRRLVLHKGVRLADGLPVMIKLPGTGAEPAYFQPIFKEEWAIGSMLQHPGLVQYLSLEEADGIPVIILEYFDGVPLKAILREAALSISDFLKTGIAIASALSAIHAKKIIHKDINPSTIFLDPGTGVVKIIDFGSASRIRKEFIEANDSFGQVSLAYLSPEQTGRANRLVTYRTDFYSLGITFYEMLAGHPPYESADDAEMIYSHLAKPLPDLKGLRPDLPQALLNIIRKLANKNAEERYKGAVGLVADLEYCRAQWEEKGSIDDFMLGTKDISTVLQVPEKLYGRESQLAEMVDCMNSIRGGGIGILFLSGYSGIGKSSLVMELYSKVARSRGRFITGKFDQFQKDIPYSAILASYRQFLQNLLSEGAESLAAWKARFMQHLGTDAMLVTAVLPELELIIGQQPTVTIEDPEKFKIRFISAFRSFIRAIASDGTPLVIFLDDLQWIDLASLQLIMNMLSLVQEGEKHYILLIGAYRDNEVGPEHPLYMAIKELQRTGIRIRRLELGPLQSADVNALVAETLEMPAGQCAPLSDLIFDKTRGNPFFVNRFLDSLYDNGLAWFDTGETAWRWNLEGIQTADNTDNVLQLISRTVATLSANTQELLKIASCLGQRFAVDDLQELSAQNKNALNTSLEEATNNGIIFKVKSETAGSFRFQHDRVQHVAYGLIGAEELPGLHHRIGFYLLKKAMAAGTVDDALFNILSHLNPYTVLVTDAHERRLLATFNLKAANKAMLSAAYQSAMGFGEKALELLPPHAWDAEYALWYELNLLGAKCAYLLADHPTVHRYTSELLAHVQAPMERLAVHEILGYSYSQRQMWKESMTESLRAVEAFGIRIPQKPNKLTVIRYLAGTMAQMRFMVPEKLETLPKLDDPQIESILRVLISGVSAAYLSDSLSFSILVMAIVRLQVKYGNSIYAAYAYTAFGVLLGGALGMMKFGYRYATAGKRIFDLHPHENSLAKVYFAFYCFADHWKNDLRLSFPRLMEGYTVGREKGDIEYSSWCISHRAVYGVLAGTNLHDMQEEFNMVMRVCYDQKQVHAVCNIYRKYIAWLLGNGMPEDDPLDTAWDDKDTRHYEEIQHLSALMQHKMMVGYRNLYYGRWEAVWHYASASEKLKDAVVGMYYYPVVLFEQALAGIKLAGMGRLSLKAAGGAIATFRKWATLNPVNHGHRLTLIEAERAALTGDHPAAGRLFDSAVREAQGHRHMQDFALACELAAFYYRKQGNQAQFETYLRQACDAFGRWGATRLAQKLRSEYPDILLAGADPGAGGMAMVPGRLTNQALDIQAIINASEAISGELQLRKLLATIVHIVVENAGAERVVVLLNHHDSFDVVAEIASGEETIRVDDPVPLERFDELAAGVVQYVIRSKTFIVLGDATTDTRFSAEPYIARTRQRSLMCLPLVKGGQIKAIVYLENKLMAGAFTPDRVQTLNLLSSQAAIALENATYYNDMHIAYGRIEQLNLAYERFVPKQFLNLLERKSITDIGLADQSVRDMPILFSDIRNFTAISEQLPAQEVFNLLNEVLHLLIPCIQDVGGIIDKFIGDAIMALFPGKVDEALVAAVSMNARLNVFNEARAATGQQAIKIGIGLHAGPMILGTVGSENRLNTTVIGDTVNIAARLEKATKEYKTSLIVSGDMVKQLEAPEKFHLRQIGYATVKGKSKDILVYEEYSNEDAWMVVKKDEMQPAFNKIIQSIAHKDGSSASFLLSDYCSRFPEDTVAAYYKARLKHTIQESVD